MTAEDNRCSATLIDGRRCPYQRRDAGELCGIHQKQRERRAALEQELAKQLSSSTSAERSHEETVKELRDRLGKLGREERLALVVATGLALVELVEKAVHYMPALLALLERYSHVSVYGEWNAASVLENGRAISQCIDANRASLMDNRNLDLRLYHDLRMTLLTSQAALFGDDVSALSPAERECLEQLYLLSATFPYPQWRARAK